MQRIKCQLCKKEFDAFPSNKRKFCSKECYRKFASLFPNPQAFQKGHPNYLIKHTEESKKKMRGRRVPWVKVTCEECGKIFEVSPSRIKDRFCSASCSLKWQYKHNPKVGFQKGHLDIVPPKSRKKAGKKISIAMTGKKLSDEHRKNLSRKKTEEEIQKLREWSINHPNKQFKDTKIELKIEAELKKRNINYKKQEPLCKVARVDFLLPEHKIVIQCDGCYYHGCPIHHPGKYQDRKKIDKNQDKVLKENGFIVYRFWEHEINESAEKCVKKIKEICDCSK